MDNGSLFIMFRYLDPTSHNTQLIKKYYIKINKNYCNGYVKFDKSKNQVKPTERANFDRILILSLAAKLCSGVL